MCLILEFDAGYTLHLLPGQDRKCNVFFVVVLFLSLFSLLIYYLNLFVSTLFIAVLNPIQSKPILILWLNRFIWTVNMKWKPSNYNQTSHKINLHSFAMKTEKRKKKNEFVIIIFVFYRVKCMTKFYLFIFIDFSLSLFPCSFGMIWPENE